MTRASGTRARKKRADDLSTHTPNTLRSSHRTSSRPARPCGIRKRDTNPGAISQAMAEEKRLDPREITQLFPGFSHRVFCEFQKCQNSQSHVSKIGDTIRFGESSRRYVFGLGPARAEAAAHGVMSAGGRHAASRRLVESSRWLMTGLEALECAIESSNASRAFPWRSGTRLNVTTSEAGNSRLKMRVTHAGEIKIALRVPSNTVGRLIGKAQRPTIIFRIPLVFEIG